MSQPRDDESENEALQDRIDSEESLQAFFRSFEKPRSQFRIGVEHERFVVDPHTLKPIPWDGPKGMHGLMKDFLAAYQSEGAQAGDDRGQTIAVMRSTSSITLEPGCQLELSGAPLQTITEIDNELTSYESVLDGLLKKRGLASLPMGFHPTAFHADYQWVPKQRYVIMKRYMQTTGTRGHDMMLRTCTVQGNFDYNSEVDMVNSFRVGLLASPVITALFATSPFKEGKPSGFLSERTPVWHDTDADRSGFPLEVFDDEFGYARWVARALDTPMYFVRRAGVYHDATTITFREFMKNGLGSFTACKRDFADHLTTLFTDVRIKPQLETRGADCGPKPLLRALPAFWKGLLYDVDARRKALAILSQIDPNQLPVHQIDAAKNGLQARLGSSELGAVAADLLAICKEALKDEGHYLKPLQDIVASGQNVAQRMLGYYKQNNGSFDWLLDPLKAPLT